MHLSCLFFICFFVIFFCQCFLSWLIHVSDSEHGNPSEANPSSCLDGATPVTPFTATTHPQRTGGNLACLSFFFFSCESLLLILCITSLSTAESSMNASMYHDLKIRTAKQGNKRNRRKSLKCQHTVLTALPHKKMKNCKCTIVESSQLCKQSCQKTSLSQCIT